MCPQEVEQIFVGAEKRVETKVNENIKLIQIRDSYNNEMWIIEYKCGKKQHFISENRRAGDKGNGKME